MYIFEAIIKYIKGKKLEKIYSDYIPEDITEKPQDCEHLFMPLDTSKELFACKYCGTIVSKDKLKDKNIFKRNN